MAFMISGEKAIAIQIPSSLHKIIISHFCDLSFVFSFQFFYAMSWEDCFVLSF
jgi:hypothetical protein